MKLLVIVQHMLHELNFPVFPDELTRLILDYYSISDIMYCNGSGLTQIGFAGSNYPSFSFPSIVGRNVNKNETIVGAQAYDCLEHSFPLQNGCVGDWNDMKLLFDYALHNCLHLDKAEIQQNSGNILLSQSGNIRTKDMERIYEYMFEQYGFSGVMIVPKQVLVLYAQGLLTGTVFDSGSSMTHCVCVYEGYELAMTKCKLNIGGRHITRQLLAYLNHNGYTDLHRSADYNSMNHMKEEVCYIAYDIQKERLLAAETTVLCKKYQLPDGRIITVNNERFEAVEVLFEPYKAGISAPGAHDMLFRCIMKSDVDLRREFWKHIVLCGGNTKFNGFASRLEKEVKEKWIYNVAQRDKSLTRKLKLKITQPMMQDMVFVGGSVLCDLMKQQNEFWLNKNDWNEKGAAQAVQEHHA
eukprot:202087_1